MLNKMRMAALANLALVLIFVANSTVGTRSVFIMYEPDIPDCLK